jgi:type I restriction enzyme S subunit
MIADLKPYPAYKDSGVPWLGKVPSMWNIARNGGLFVQRNETGFAHLPILEVSLKTGVGVRNFDESGRKQVMSDRDKYKRARKGDLAYNMMRMWQGAIGMAPIDGLVSPAYVVARPLRGIEPRFYLNLFRTDAYMGEIDKFSHGIVKDRNRLYWEDFKQMPSLVPPLEEQAAIVRFLDQADRLIKRYIRTKQKLIKLLEEQKQAIIHRAVTRGLDPNVRLKPSGVEWLGDVPGRWEVVRLKTLVSQVTSGSRGWSRFEADLGPLFIRIGNLTRASIDLDFSDVVRLNLPREALNEGIRTKVQVDDLLLSITAYIGSVAVVPEGIEEAFVSQHVACCRPRRDAANVRWVGYVLLSRVGQVHGQLCMYGGTKQGLSLDDVKNYVVLLPSRKEQDALVKWIEMESKNVDHAIASTHREISLLREYRTRLIADVVTGKLDVREAAAKLPDESEKSDSVDDAGYVEGEEGTEDPDLAVDPEEAEV